MSADPFDPKVSTSVRQRIWGAAVLLAIAVITLPFLLDGSGSESENKFRRVEKLRQEPPIIVERDGVATPLPIPDSDQVRISFDSLTGENGGTVDADSLSDQQGPSSTDFATTNEGSEAGLPATQRPAEGPGSPAGVSGPGGVAGNAAATETDNLSGVADNAPGTRSGAIDAADSQITARLNPQGGEAVASQQALSAWVVLAGAFVTQVDALGVRDRLRQAGFAAFVQDREANDELFRVLVGPMIKEDAALDALEEVAALLGSNATVLSYP